MLALVATALTQTPSAAREREAAVPTSAGASGVPLPAGLKAPQFPVLPGVVGPDVTAVDASLPGPETPSGTDAVPGQVVQDARGRDFVPPAAPTWDQAAETGMALTGARTRSTARDGGGGAWVVVLVVGVALGSLAGLAATIASGRSRMGRQPVSILRSPPGHDRRPMR